MTTEDARSYYDTEYAATYDADFQDGPLWSIEAEHHVRSLGPLVREPGVRWLDVGCGTGWFLGRFPGVTRAGTDYSPAMLEQARRANPDALFLREHDARVDVPEWHDEWDVVSCTGQPYSYFATMDEVEALAANLARWTRPGGTCVVQVCDLLDLSGYLPSYDFDHEITDGHSISITGALWSWADTTGTLHKDMLWPSLDVWVRWFKRWFRTVEVVHWPHDPPAPYLMAPRRLLVMTGKRVDGDDEPATVVVHPPPEVDAVDPLAPVASGVPQGAPADVAGRADDEDASAAEALTPAPEVAPAPEPPAPVEDFPPHVCPPNRSAAAVPTGALVRELGRRLSPADGRAARAAWRRVRRLGPTR